MGKWRAIAPIWAYGDEPGAVRDGIDLAHGVRLMPTPAFLREENALKWLDSEMRHRVEFEAPYCLSVEYEAERPQHEDPEDPRSTLQYRAEALLSLASLAMWIARPAPVGFEVVYHTDRVDGLGYGEIHRPQQLLVRYENKNGRLNVDAFARARDLHQAIGNLPRDGNLWNAVVMLWRGVVDDRWETTFFIYWIVLEALFGVDDAREIRHRLSQRAGFFLGADRAGAKRIYSEAKKSYDWRSKVVHGLRLSGLNQEKAGALLAEAEGLVRDSLTKVLLDPSLLAVFDSKGRSDYLDGLVFA